MQTNKIQQQRQQPIARTRSNSNPLRGLVSKNGGGGDGDRDGDGAGGIPLWQWLVAIVVLILIFMLAMWFGYMRDP